MVSSKSVLCVVYVVCGLVSMSGLVRGLFNPDSILRKSITKHGYPVELHKVTTTDGYILTIARIPSPRSPVVLFNHGLFSSSIDWHVQGRANSIAFEAADAGYDVWLGNVRGTTFSKTHTNLSNLGHAYWKFSLHEIGIHDLPAMIDYILAHDSVHRRTLHYVALSQGGAVFLVMASMRPEYNAKFDSVHLMAPAALLGHGTSPLLALAYRLDELLAAAEFIKLYEIGGRGTPDSLMDQIYNGHKTGIIPTETILPILGTVFGNYEFLNRTVLTEVLANTPAGSSIYQWAHFAQNVLSKSFRMYDYGSVSNIKRYEAIEPPEYPLCNVTAPVFLYYSDGDTLVSSQDVERLATRVPNVVQKYKMPSRKWTHLDFVFHSKARRFYQMVVGSFKNFSIIKRDIE